MTTGKTLTDAGLDRTEAFWVGTGSQYDDLRRAFEELRALRALRAQRALEPPRDDEGDGMTTFLLVREEDPCPTCKGESRTVPAGCQGCAGTGVRRILVSLLAALQDDPEVRRMIRQIADDQPEGELAWGPWLEEREE
jgi:hypothetical protein